MSKSDTTFNSISEAVDYVVEGALKSDLSDEDRSEIMRIQRGLKHDLPAIQYAINLFYAEPKLVTGKKALAIACGNLYAQICEIDAIRNYGDSSSFYDTDHALIKLNIFKAMNYLQHQLSRAHRNLCSSRYR